MNFNKITSLMKITSFLTFLLLLMAITSTAQSKKDIENELTLCYKQADSLKKVLNALRVDFDSLSKSNASYQELYRTLGAKLSPEGKEPADLSNALDSLIKHYQEALKTGNALSDSMGYWRLTADSLGQEVGHLKYIISKYIVKGSMPLNTQDFIGSWTLLTQWFEIYVDSPMTGLVLLPPPPGMQSLARIKFVDHEIAELTLANGEVIRSFYKIFEFSIEKPYRIELSKGSELNINLIVCHTNEGELQVSYKRGNGYFQGTLRKQ
jgi:hypothetical protein